MNIDSILLSLLSNIAIEASFAILEVYQQSEVAVHLKGDGSPLTIADLKAHDIISKTLAKLTPDIPVISEEDNETISRVKAQNPTIFWLIDPLDGSKEFIKRNGEFTVNIALIQNNRPIVGVIAQPTTQKIYAAINQNNKQQVYETDFDNKASVRPLSVKQTLHKPIIMTGSRSHQNQQSMSRWMNALKTNTFQPIGSSLKFCLIASGQADIYVRESPTMIWDTAAGDAILQAAGGEVLTTHGKPLFYSLKELRNPSFIAASQKRMILTTGIEEGLITI